MKKFKKGVASFYIVAFSTLILVIIAASFATVVISEVTRTSNDDLSQSAYDSALAGVEDAKLAYANYRKCLASGYSLSSATTPDGNGTITCGEIMYWMKEENRDCDMVAHILGRIPDRLDAGGEVPVSDTITVGSNDVTSELNQAYTCVEIKTKLDDYRATLTSSNRVKVVKVEFESPASAAKIKRIRFSWYSQRDDVTPEFSNFVNDGGWQVAFQPMVAVRAAAPPTVELQMIQTGTQFTLSDFDTSNGSTTNRATMYFVPTNNPTAAAGSKTNNYTGIWKGNVNAISAFEIANTNRQAISNLPFGTYCNNGGSAEFMCSVVLELPEPKNGSGSRSADTFMFMVTIPYGQPETDFAMEFFCANDNSCGNLNLTDLGVGSFIPAQITGAQVVIDSTGRANDLYRRVETRLESASEAFTYAEYAVQLLGDNSSIPVMSKDLTVTYSSN